MALEQVPSKTGWGKPTPDYSKLEKLFKELQGLKVTVVNGSAPDTDIPVAGIMTEDTLVGVVKLDFTLTEGAPNTRTWDVDDLLSEAAITSNGNIRLSTTDTTGAVLLVAWFDKSY